MPFGFAVRLYDQLVQNILLGWLGGSCIIEPKMVQTLHEAGFLPWHPTSVNVVNNVERRSQEVAPGTVAARRCGAAMFIEILKALRLLCNAIFCDGGDIIFYMKRGGYDWQGIAAHLACGHGRSR